MASSFSIPGVACRASGFSFLFTNQTPSSQTRQGKTPPLTPTRIYAQKGAPRFLWVNSTGANGSVVVTHRKIPCMGGGEFTRVRPDTITSLFYYYLFFCARHGKRRGDRIPPSFLALLSPALAKTRPNSKATLYPMDGKPRGAGLCEACLDFRLYSPDKMPDASQGMPCGTLFAGPVERISI